MIKLASTIAAPLATLLVCAASLDAQTEVDLKWQRSHVIIRYNPVRFGKHSLSELSVGQEWRMGMNTASTMSTDVPLVGESGLVAPGSYRVNLRRSEERSFGLQVVSTQLATGGSQAFFPAALEDAEETAKLELSWLEATTKKKGAEIKKPSGNEKGTEVPPVDPVDGKHAQRSTLRLLFGAYRLDMPITMIAAKPAKVRGYKASAFEWPEALFRDQVKKGHAVPVLTLRGKGGSKSRPRIFNLLINDEKAEIYPAMVAPTKSFGFAGVDGFGGNDIMRGTIEWSDSQTAASFMTVKKVAVKSKKLQLEIAVGKRLAKITVPMPKAR